MKAFKAYGKAGHVTRSTARDAAAAYFAEFTTARKCSVIEGDLDGPFFVTTYDSRKAHFYAKDVTKNKVAELPA